MAEDDILETRNLQSAICNLQSLIYICTLPLQKVNNVKLPEVHFQFVHKVLKAALRSNFGDVADVCSACHRSVA